MCGLYGFINRGSKFVNVNKLMQGLAVSAQSRGTDATGVSYNIKSHLCTVKSATSADKFVFDLPATVSCAIGHTRRTTQGSEQDNYNNHPFNGIAGDTMFALAHNGVLDNDYDLQTSESLPKTNIKTDSYVAVQLIEKYAKEDKSLTLDAIRKMSELVSGMFAFSILDSNNQFWLVRNDSPIHMAYFEKLNLYVYGSTEQIVKDGLKSAGLSQKYATIKIKEGSIIHIDDKGNLNTFTFKVNYASYNRYNPKYKLASANSNKTDYYNGWFGRYDDYLEDTLTLDMQEQGLTDDEIDLMFLSYTAYEIEQAVYSGVLMDLFLVALRDFHSDTVEGVSRKRYVSPVCK